MVWGGGSSTIALSLLSLVAGTFLLVRTCKEEMCCRWFPKVVAYVVIVISIIMLICSGYWRIVKISHYGWGSAKWGMTRGGRGMMGGMGMMKGMKGMSPEMMEEMMKRCPMMQMMQGEEEREEREGEEE